jgi:hypothetical protein
MTLRDHTAAWKRLRQAVSCGNCGELPGAACQCAARSIRSRVSRAWARWTRRRDQAQRLRIDVAFLRMELTRIETALADERKRRTQAEADLAADRFIRNAFLNTMHMPQSKRPRG